MRYVDLVALHCSGDEDSELEVLFETMLVVILLLTELSTCTFGCTWKNSFIELHLCLHYSCGVFT